MAGTRDKILDALERVLAAAGPSGTTLEAVALEAGVSKGGLLYHFGSKDALFNGLLDRLRDLGARDAAKRDPRGVVAAYLATSSTAQDAYTRTLMACMRLLGTPGVEVEQAIIDSLDHWKAVLEREVTDPVMVRAIMLIGDGLYLRALLGAQTAPDAGLIEYVQDVVRGASQP